MITIAVIEGGEIEVKRLGLLTGRYETHEEPPDRVDLFRKIPGEADGLAHFYAIGTYPPAA